jgi:regulator of sigma E protease
MVMTLFYFFLALLILITVHEFGHFWVARKCGVKVLRFSFGFGKVLFSWRDKKQTEYAFSAFPLGGYVKMLDETEEAVPQNERHLAFNNQAVYKKTAIVLAGPLFNFIFAILALWLMNVIGISSLAPIIGSVKQDSIAAHAGVKPNQEVLAVNGEKVSSWRQFQYAIIPIIGTSSPLKLSVKSNRTNQQQTLALDLSNWQLDSKNPDILTSFGIEPYIPKVPPIVGTVVEGMPAQSAGIKTGDIILSMNEEPIDDWFKLVQKVQNSPGESLRLTVLRGKKRLTFEIRPVTKTLNKQTVGFIGLTSKKYEWPKQWFRTHRYSPIMALKKAIIQTMNLSITTVKMIGRLIIGKISFKTISGPIGIAQGAGQSAQGGMAYYLSFLALVSISLGVLNLLPIPMLDGGHLLYYFVEIIIRREVSEQAKALGFNIGLILLITLMILAVFNDVSRLVG